MSEKCKYFEGCPIWKHMDQSVKILKLLPVTNRFCLDDENSPNCKLYQLKEQEKPIPESLMPDGNYL